MKKTLTINLLLFSLMAIFIYLSLFFKLKDNNLFMAIFLFSIVGFGQILYLFDKKRKERKKYYNLLITLFIIQAFIYYFNNFILAFCTDLILLYFIYKNELTLQKNRQKEGKIFSKRVFILTNEPILVFLVLLALSFIVLGSASMIKDINYFLNIIIVLFSIYIFSTFVYLSNESIFVIINKLKIGFFIIFGGIIITALFDSLLNHNLRFDFRLIIPFIFSCSYVLFYNKDKILKISYEEDLSGNDYKYFFIVFFVLTLSLIYFLVTHIVAVLVK